MTKTPTIPPAAARAAAKKRRTPNEATVGARVAAPSAGLDALALGEVTPVEALAVIRASLLSKEPPLARVYDSVRSMTWKLFAERVVGDKMRPWFDILRQTSALFAALEAVELSAKVAAFADLAIESERFGYANAIDEMSSRAHVRDILRSLRDRGGTALRSTVLSDTKLKQANLSRVLAHMASAGFIERHSKGREVELRLTSQGKEAITSPPDKGAGGLITIPPLDEEVDKAAALRSRFRSAR